MTETEEIRKMAVARLDIVRLYMAGSMDVVRFARTFNEGSINWQMLKEYGPIDAEDVDRWADICMELGEEVLNAS